ncbi:MAG: Panacea domain-containing protein, partial [bacterium]
MRPITFRFDPEKAINTLAFFSRHGIPGLDQMKIAKLVFLADRVHLLRYGRTITGDTYVCMEHGPVPSATRDLVNARLAEDPDAEPMQQYFDVRQVRQYPELVAKRDPDLEVFSDSDIEVLTEVAEQYGPK